MSVSFVTAASESARETAAKISLDGGLRAGGRSMHKSSSLPRFEDGEMGTDVRGNRTYESFCAVAFIGSCISLSSPSA